MDDVSAPANSEPPASTRSGRVIRASEIGQYAYCARAWWLSSVKGVPSINTREMAQGEATHQRHGRLVWTAAVLRLAALVLAAVAVLLVAAALLLPH
ncbi:MAG TPA: hypothetical protein VGK87_03415 [Anaerolineae bacterium]|jgi:CRISPR/Cas system-associated exonuclease Cas4 (RecB family)